MQYFDNSSESALFPLIQRLLNIIITLIAKASVVISDTVKLKVIFPTIESYAMTSVRAIFPILQIKNEF